MSSFKYFFIIVLFACLSFQAKAEIKYYRWVNQYGLSDNLQDILSQLNRESGQNLSYADFQLYEHRDMAHYRFSTFLQTFQGFPIRGAMIRTWVDLQTGHLVQMEAHIEDNASIRGRTKFLKSQNFSLDKLTKKIRSMNSMSFVREAMAKATDDKLITDVKWSDEWSGEDLQRVIRAKARYGTHIIRVSLFKNEIISQTYEEFPRADVAALVYPIYEETEKDHKIQQRIPVVLKHLLDYRKQITTDPYAVLRNRRYDEMKMDPVLGMTPEGQMQGYWSYSWLMNSVRMLYDALPWEPNNFENGGVYLEGQYATVSLHPDVAQLKGIKFHLNMSGHVKFIEKEAQIDGNNTWEMIPMAAYRGQLITDSSNALNRPARRLPDHNMIDYINDGFDEIQVYYAIDQLVESLHNMGFTDPELSTRAFNAFLYDPDVGMRDNAYYTSDTINFTTYSPDNQNFARDNSTIWHELGHGVMDRLMGDMITLADTGGLSEGMADFIAKLVVEDVTEGQPFDGENDFRIINRTGFNLTNEVHDDGEAYGGTMRDILELAIQKYGRDGLKKMTDLTLDTMRLTRNHPGLTANDWFEHMLFADELGHSPVRQQNDMKALILEALQSRNFRLDHGDVAEFKVFVGEDELTGKSTGSRERPYRLELKANQTADYQLKLSLKSSSDFAFHYPVKIEANFNGGPLEGAVKWSGENNGPKVFTLQSESEVAALNLTVLAGCDFVNREDGTCADYTYIKVYNAGESLPIAKKRFYVRVKNAQ